MTTRFVFDKDPVVGFDNFITLSRGIPVLAIVGGELNLAKIIRYALLCKHVSILIVLSAFAAIGPKVRARTAQWSSCERAKFFDTTPLADGMHRSE
jgi:hypothetical protein